MLWGISFRVSFTFSKKREISCSVFFSVSVACARQQIGKFFKDWLSLKCVHECVLSVGGFDRSLQLKSGYQHLAAMEKFQEVEQEEQEQVYEGEEPSEPR